MGLSLMERLFLSLLSSAEYEGSPYTCPFTTVADQESMGEGTEQFDGTQVDAALSPLVWIFGL